MSQSISGIILAGGKSRRFGSPKAFAQKDGIPFYQFTIDAMRPFAESIILVTNTELARRFIVDQGITVVTDDERIAGLGPLAGVYSGMEKVDAEWYLISPIDVPFIEAKIYQILLQNLDCGKEAIVPVVNGRIEPLVAIYHYSLKEKMLGQLERGELAPKQLFTRSQVAFVEINEEKPFRNINYQDDLNRYAHKKDS